MPGKPWAAGLYLHFSKGFAVCNNSQGLPPSGSSIGAALSSGRAIFLVERMGAVRLAIETTLRQPQSFARMFKEASVALLLQGEELFESTLLAIDRAATEQLEPDEDRALANALKALMR